jgi:hypothetical protein
MTRRYRRLHRAAALIVGAFVLAHLANHLVALAGITAHTRVLSALRLAYRHPVGEATLLAAILVQIVSGLSGFRSGWRRPGVARWQAVSGLYLALFFIGHTAAIQVGRFAFHLDTNFYFAAAPLLIGWLPLWFFPYYGAGVIAVGLHLGAVAYWRAPRQARRLALAVPLGVAVIAAVLILSAFSGQLFPVTLPAENVAPYATLVR